MTPRAVTLCELEVIPISDPQARMGQEGRKRFWLSASEPDHTEVFRNYFLLCVRRSSQTNAACSLNMLIFRAFVSHGKLTFEMAS